MRVRFLSGQTDGGKTDQSASRRGATLTERSIQELRLRTSVKNALLRQGISHVSQLEQLSAGQILRLRGIGVSGLREIKYAIRLGRPLETSDQGLLAADVLVRLASHLHLSRVSIKELELSVRVENALDRAGIRTLGDLLGRDVQSVARLRGFGARALEETRQAVDTLATAVQQGGWVSRYGWTESREVERTDSAPQHQLQTPPWILGEEVPMSESAPSLDECVASLLVPDRAWELLERRVGPHERLTLEAVAKQFRLTRERVRQIQQHAVRCLNKRLRQAVPALNVLDVEADNARGLSVGTIPFETVLSHYQRALSRAGWRDVSERSLLRLAVMVRAVCDSGNVAVEAEWPNSSFVICAAPPPIRAHSRVASQLRREASEEKAKNRTWTYAELVQAVLQAAGSPLHWREIVARAEELGHHEKFSAQSLFNAMVANPEKFARTGPGTYGLTTLGHIAVDPYVDIIAGVLRVVGKPLSYGELLQRVTIKRPIKPGSFQMYVDLHPRFYKSVQGSYGLRSWLPPRGKQTLRTPRTLVEDSDSLQRVDRAKAKGYRVDAIVERDLSSGATMLTAELVIAQDGPNIARL